MSNTNKLFKYLKNWHWSSYLLLAFVLLQFFMRSPSILRMVEQQGTMALRSEVVGLTDAFQAESIVIPQEGRRQVIVFWATWCGPCKLELTRINNLVASGKIQREQIVAVSVGEDFDLVRSVAKDSGYLFKVAIDVESKMANAYKVSGTPTIVFINEYGQIEWLTMGVTPTLEIRILNFLEVI